MNLVKTVSRSNFYTDFVNILNGVLQLSNREAEVFSWLLHYSDNGFDYNVNHKEIRKNIKMYLGISEANLSRYLNTLKTKGLMVKGKDSKWVINDNIKPDISKDFVDIRFVLKLEDKTNNDDIKINSQYSKDEELQNKMA